MALDLATASLAEIAGGLRVGDLTAGAIADWAIDNHEQRGEALHAYKTWDSEKIRAEATAADATFGAGVDLGPLQGMPVSVKDLIGVAGYPTFAGCPRELPERWRTEGPIVRAIRGQLAVISGKAHTVQFAFGGMGANRHWGPPRNPWDADHHRSPAGSSSGAGVSLHEGSALLAIGTDTAGSVRMPATVTGSCGIRPTPGRWSIEGIVPLVPSLDTPGPITRSAEDLVYGFAAIDPILGGDVEGFLGLLADVDISDFRIGVCDWYFRDCDPGVAERVHEALVELEKAGARVGTATIPHLDDVSALNDLGGLHIGEFASFINNEMRDYKDDLDPAVAIRLADSENYTAEEHLRRVRDVDRMAAAADAGFGAFDAIVGPTIPITPPKMTDIATPETHLLANTRFVQNTVTVSLLHQCAATAPVGLDMEDMPVGMQIVGSPGSDETVLAVALACERVLGRPRERLGASPMGI
ncbi:MAG: 2-amino-5-chloromuconate deaminase [Alphaproteobacteria bacterium]|nr:2-amino-5-chloromuconate deaminase [Alphaproteobacteria bacterium]HCP01521.1 2-amino-5-chloromuconate deaminase [Rhodospirillaceae bacterium]